ncbi:MAG: hypothetical protein A2157_13375 [Deltaproteobacteria bacterium RBG_16_47_11]|nr:MAG: hypothetical protein A2157_13375 [Deltaproteobacteria bacterium RBG_16_47_11]
MYLGIDFLISPQHQTYVVEVNVGLPGGAQEYHLTHLVHFGKPSDIFAQIEETSKRVYGKTFKDYLHSLSFIGSLKPFKIWMDGRGPFPSTFHPGLRLEDKWIQYQLIQPITPMPETTVFNQQDRPGSKQFLGRKGKLVLKRRLGRGGRNFKLINDLDSLCNIDTEGHACLLQEFIESKVSGYTFSIRSVAFGGEFMCMYANLSTRSYSNHGMLTFVSPGNRFELADKEFKTKLFNQKSWEAGIWFGEETPPYLQHNLYEDEVAKTTLYLPEPILKTIKELSVKIERFYEGLDFSSLPKACFETPYP